MSFFATFLTEKESKMTTANLNEGTSLKKESEDFANLLVNSTPEQRNLAILGFDGISKIAALFFASGGEFETWDGVARAACARAHAQITQFYRAKQGSHDDIEWYVKTSGVPHTVVVEALKAPTLTEMSNYVANWMTKNDPARLSEIKTQVQIGLGSLLATHG